MEQITKPRQTSLLELSDVTIHSRCTLSMLPIPQAEQTDSGAKYIMLSWLPTLDLFSSEKISDFGTVSISFVCDKYYPIMD